MKKTAILSMLFALLSFTSFSQMTYIADTAFTTDVGYDGAAASCIFNGGNKFGWQINRLNGSWVADIFTVPADSSWVFDTIIVYGYQVGSGSVSTFLNCNLQIYNGIPGLGGEVIWGDTSTNILVNTGFTGIYRVDTIAVDGGLTSTERPIMYLKLLLSPAPHLTAGTYWLSWSASGTLTATTSSPEKVLPGRVNPMGQTARQMYGGAWTYIIDNGDNIGMNFIIKASNAVSSVPTTTNEKSIALNQNFPNPCSESTNITFFLGEEGWAKISIYNLIGQLVATVFDQETNAGIHQITANVKHLPRGVYYYQLFINGFQERKKMLIE